MVSGVTQLHNYAHCVYLLYNEPLQFIHQETMYTGVVVVRVLLIN